MVLEARRCAVELHTQCRPMMFGLQGPLWLTAGSHAACPQLKTNGAVPMLEYACSKRVVPVNTTVLSARR